MQVYLAHSVWERERGKAMQATLEGNGFTVFNPFYPPCGPRRETADLDVGIRKPWTITDSDTAEHIVMSDLAGVRTSHLVAAIVPAKRTIGIPCEMMYAWLNHIPIIALVPEDMRGHPWLGHLCDRVFTHEEAFVGAIRAWGPHEERVAGREEAEDAK